MPSTPLRVLYLEDEPAAVKLLERELKRAGFDPSGERVDSRKEFLDHLDPKLDMIFSDFTMPGFNGLEALRLMKSSDIDLPFIFVSGTIGEDVAVTAMHEGAADYLIKDRLGRLGSAVKQALARWRQKEETLIAEQTAARLAAIVENSNDAIIAMTLDGIITSWNPAGERQYGYSAQEILGRHISILFPQGRRRSDAPENLDDILTRVGNGERIDAFETVRVRRDRQRIEVLLSISPIRAANGDVTGASAIVHDITQRKRSDRFLKAEQSVAVILADAVNLEEAGPKVLQTVAECLRWEVAVLWLVDCDANVLCRRFSWHSPWADTNFVEVLSQKTVLETAMGVAGRVWSTGKPIWEPGISMDGQPAKSAPLTGEGLHGDFGFPLRQASRTVGVIEFYNPELREPDQSLLAALDNITGQISHFCERRQAEADLRASTNLTQMQQQDEQCRQSQELKSTGQLAGRLAHDFNNLLTIVIGYSEVMQRSFKANNPNHSHVHQVIQAAERASALTQQLLAFSRRQVLFPQIQDLYADLADPGQEEQMLVHQAVHAQEAMPRSEKLTPCTQDVELGAAACLGHCEDDDNHLANESDEGIRLGAKSSCEFLQLPPERLPALEREWFSQRKISRERRDHCRHLQLLQNQTHEQHPSTHYRTEPIRICACLLHGYKSANGMSDADAVVDDYKRSFCAGCPDRSPKG